MKKYIYIFVFLAFSAHSQEVTSPSLLSSAGASLEGWGLTSLKMDLSIGEIFINTYSSDDFLLTQGFHQNNIHISSLSENFNLELSVFPNPTNSILNLSLKDISMLPIQAKIIDVSGKQWFISGSFYDKTNTISLDGLAEGVYFLIVENKNLKNIYKIHKTK